MGEQLRNESLVQKKSAHSDTDTDRAPPLRSLMLYDNGLKDTGFAHIVEGLAYLKTVKALNYFGNELGCDSIERLEDLTWE